MAALRPREHLGQTPWTGSLKEQYSSSLHRKLAKGSQRARKKARTEARTEAHTMEAPRGGGPIRFTFNKTRGAAVAEAAPQVAALEAHKEAHPSQEPPQRSLHHPLQSSPPPADEPPWLQAGLLVRITNGDLEGGAYCGRAGVVRRLAGEYAGHVQMVQGSAADVLLVDQDDCEPLLPAGALTGHPVLVVRGAHRGARATIVGEQPHGKAALDVEIEGAPRGHRIALPRSHLCQHIAVTR